MSAPDPSTLIIHRARSFWARLGGLLAREPLQAHEALYLAPCNSVHTFFMRYPIDVAFLDGTGRVLKLVADLQPWRIAACRGARGVIELRSEQAARWCITVDSTVPMTSAIALNCNRLKTKMIKREQNETR